MAFERLFTAVENDKYPGQIDSAAGIAAFVGAAVDRARWIRVGQACQRLALGAIRLGLKLAFINQPVEVARLRPELGALIGAPKRTDLVLRFGYGPILPYAPRRPVKDVTGS